MVGVGEISRNLLEGCQIGPMEVSRTEYEFLFQRERVAEERTEAGGWVSRAVACWGRHTTISPGCRLLRWRVVGRD